MTLDGRKAVGTKGADPMDGLTERQKKWFATVRANFESQSGRSMVQWIEIARACPHERYGARRDWLKQEYGLGANHAAYVLSEAFPSDAGGWDDPAALRTKLWSDPACRAILEAVERLVSDLPDGISGQRKGFTSFSRQVQYAAMKPARGGAADLGLAVDPAVNARLGPAKNEGWSERLKSVIRLTSPDQVDGEIAVLLRQAWERS